MLLNVTVLAVMRVVQKQLFKTFILASVALALFTVYQHVNTYAIARGYSTVDRGLQSGMTVSLDSNGSENDSVQRATQESNSLVVGVATSIENSLVTISSGTASVLVESDGQVEAYVSDINGEVEKGDSLILSPLKGILMRAPQDTTLKVVGVTVQLLSESEIYQYEGNEKKSDTRISKVLIDLSYLRAGNSGVIKNDSALAKLGKTVIGREVSETRVIVALIIFVIVLMAEAGILYGAISGAMTSLGRNPLAGKFIRSELIRVILVAIVLLLVGLAAVYIILWI